MYNVSSEFLTAIKQNSRTVKASIGVGDKLITNIIPNSDFPNGSTDWTPISASIKILNGELILTPTALNGQAHIITNSVVGHKYYSMAVVNSSSPNVYFSSYGNHKYHSGNGKYEVLSLLFTATTSTIRTGLVDENTSNWGSSKIKKPLIIDLTASYGVGNEPSQIYMDELFSKVGHFNGSNTVPLKFLDDRILINALQNGNMVDTTKWTGSNSIISSASNKLSIVGTGSNSVIGAYNSTLIKPSIGSMVYVKATITSLTSLSNNIVVKLMDGTSGNIILSKTLKSPKAETSYVVTGMINIKYNFVDNLTFVVDSSYSNTTDSNSASFTVEKVTVMDITSLYGVGKEPSLAYIDSIMKSQGWFNSKQVSILETGEPTVISNFDIESSFGNDNLPTLGSTVSNKFQMSMVNDLRIQQVFVDTTLRPYTGIDIGSGVFEWVALGEFYSDDSDVIKNKMNTTLEAFDKMMQYDNMSYDSTISYPTTILNMLIEIKNKYGIRYYDTSLLQNITFPDKPIGSVRQVLGILASYMTTNATINEVGEVEFKSLNPSGFTMDASNYINFKLLSDSPISLTQLVLKRSNDNSYVNAGNTTGFSLEFENDSISDSYIQTVYARQFPLTYYGYDMKSQGMPHLQLGDTLKFKDVNSIVRTLNIISHKLTFNGGLISEFKADTPKAEVTTITSTGGSTLNKAVAQSVSNMKDDLTKAIGEVDVKLGLKVDKVTGKSLVLDSEITKLTGISIGANKVLDSTINGNILIDNVETNVYTHPTGTNPHNVTKAQVGLGNVDNVNTNNQTPTYTVASVNATLTSGEVLTTAFGKIAKAISSLITHLSDKVSHITSAERTNWNSASTNNHTHSNKNVLDNATASYTTAEKTKLSNITVDESGNITVVDNSHNHIIANVDGLQTALDGKVDDSQVLTNVPINAKFTDTVYTHPLGTNPHGTTKADVGLGGVDNTADSSKNVFSASKLTTARNVFGKSFNGTADISGKAIVYGTYMETPSHRYMNGALEIRECNLVGTSQSTIGYAPQLGFHWGSRTGGSIVMDYTGEFQVLNQAGTGYSNLRINTLFGNVTGNSSTATKLTTSREIALTGDVNGTVNFDGSGNVIMSTTVLDDSHNHVIANVDGLQTALNGKVDDSQVLTNVPSGAKFTDTVYVHPTNHSPSVITQDSSNRFVTDAEKSTWNGKATTSVATTSANGLMSSTDKVKLNGISTGANKVTNSATNGNILIDGTQTNVYTHPTGTNPHGTTKANVGLGSVDNTADNTKNVLSATKLTTPRNIFGQSFNGTTNIGGKAIVCGTYMETPSHRYMNGALEIRECDLVSSTKSDIAYAPQLGFHWSGITGASLVMTSTGEFQFLNRDGTGYNNLRVNTLFGDVTGNATSSTKLKTPRTIATSGDAIGTATNFDGSANISIPLTLATVATAGTYKSVTVDKKGRVTSGTNPTTLAGYGITDGLRSSTYTASDVLTKIKTVDGTGSGLDADLLDGNQASAFALASHGTHVAYGTTTKGLTSGGTGVIGSAATLSRSDHTHTLPAYPTLASLGVTSTVTALNYTSGVTSNIQTQLNSKATQTNINNSINAIKIGGNNLILNTSTPITLTGTGIVNQVGTLWYIDSAKTASKQITVSYDVVCSANTGTFQLQVATNPWLIGDTNHTARTTKQHISYTYTMPATTGYTRLALRLDNLTGAVTISNLKIAIGNKELEWTPAIEDMAYKITNGTTVTRPIPTHIGQCHFDTTLGKPIWCKTVATKVWVDSTGTTV